MKILGQRKERDQPVCMNFKLLILSTEQERKENGGTVRWERRVNFKK